MPRESQRSKPALIRGAAGVVLVLLALSAVAVGLTREATRAGTPKHDAAADVPAQKQVSVYYFHGDERCTTCLAIEAQTADAVREHFAPELNLGRLRFEIVNFDEPGSRHYRDEFDLAFGTVVVQGGDADRSWESLDDVWTLIHDDPGDFEAYLVEHIRAALGSGG